MDNKTQMRLRRIINYLYADEERHWQEAGEPNTNHIFHDIIRLAEWLDKAARK
jgi:hypothetical protein